MIDVLIPMYNSESFIKETLVSLESQTYKDFKVIICNDASTDDSVLIVEDFINKSDLNVILLENNDNKGIAATRNKLLDYSDSKYVAWLDSDDIALPNRLSIQFKFLEDNPQYFGCGAGRILINEVGNVINKTLYPRSLERNSKYVRFNIVYRNLFCNSTLMFKKSNHRMNLDYPPAEDYEFCSRLILLENLNFVNLKEPLVKYRIHRNNNSSNQKRQYLLNSRIISRNFKEISINDHLLINFASSCLNPEYSKGGFIGFLRFLFFIARSKVSLYQKIFTILDMTYSIILIKSSSLLKKYV